MADRNAPQSAFDAAFAELDAALIDLDGDGVPDVAVPQQSVQQPSNAMAGFAQAGQAQPANAMATSFPQMVANNPRGWGNAPPVPEATLSNATPTVGENAMSFFRQQGPIGERIAPVAGAVLDYGPEFAKGYVGQIDRTAQALSDATNDPSLANVTNAGVQTAMTFGRPMVAGGIMGAGMLEAARRDFAPDVFSPANALTRRQTRDQEMKDREAARQREAEANRIRLESEARRAEADAASKRDVETQRQRKEQEEYDRAVERAEMAKNKELSRDRRFSDTELGKIYDKTGGLAPIAAGALVGGASRFATGGSGLIKDYLLPGGLGALGGFTAANAPLFYNGFQTEPDNPEKRAFSAYSRELPAGHPRKAEAGEYASSLPDENPVRKEAYREYVDDFWPRALISGLEGVGGGLLGADLIRGVGRAGNAMASARVRGRANAMSQAPSGPSYGAPYSTYTPSATPARPQPRPVVGSDGRTRYHDPDTGNFTSAPD